MRCPRYWSFSFSISPSNEHPGLISFRMDWVDLLAVQGALESATNDTQTRDTQAALCLAHDAGPVGPWLCSRGGSRGPGCMWVIGGS